MSQVPQDPSLQRDPLAVTWVVSLKKKKLWIPLHKGLARVTVVTQAYRAEGEFLRKP